MQYGGYLIGRNFESVVPKKILQNKTYLLTGSLPEINVSDYMMGAIKRIQINSNYYPEDGFYQFNSLGNYIEIKSAFELNFQLWNCFDDHKSVNMANNVAIDLFVTRYKDNNVFFFGMLMIPTKPYSYDRKLTQGFLTIRNLPNLSDGNSNYNVCEDFDLKQMFIPHLQDQPHIIYPTNFVDKVQLQNFDYDQGFAQMILLWKNTDQHQFEQEKGTYPKFYLLYFNYSKETVTFGEQIKLKSLQEFDNTTDEHPLYLRSLNKDNKSKILVVGYEKKIDFYFIHEIIDAVEQKSHNLRMNPRTITLTYIYTLNETILALNHLFYQKGLQEWNIVYNDFLLMDTLAFIDVMCINNLATEDNGKEKQLRYLLFLECDIWSQLDNLSYDSEDIIHPQLRLISYAHIIELPKEIIIDKESLRVLVYQANFTTKSDEFYIYDFSNAIKNLNFYGREIQQESVFYSKFDNRKLVIQSDPYKRKVKQTINGTFGIKLDDEILVGNLININTVTFTKLVQTSYNTNLFSYLIEPLQTSDKKFGNSTVSMDSQMYYNVGNDSSWLNFSIILPNYGVNLNDILNSGSVYTGDVGNKIPNLPLPTSSSLYEFDIQLTDFNDNFITSGFSIRLAFNCNIIPKNS